VGVATKSPRSNHQTLAGETAEDTAANQNAVVMDVSMPDGVDLASE